MLHLRRPADGRGASAPLRWTPYALATAAIALTLAVHGPAALAYDGHPLQWFQAAMMLWLGAELFRMTGRLPPAALLLLSLGCAWLAVDELLMVHECVKWKWSEAFRGFGPDPLVLAYALLGAGAGIGLLRAHPDRKAAAPHLLLAGVGASFAVLSDLNVFGANTHLSLILEESGEFLAVSGAIAFLAAAGPRLSPRALLWVGFSAAWLFATVWLVRPWLCPARLL